MLKCLVIFALFCILVVEGGPQCAGPHESIRCVQPSCPQHTCTDKGDGRQCPSGGAGCRYRCVCDDHYYRGADGECYDAYECKWGWGY